MLLAVVVVLLVITMGPTLLMLLMLALPSMEVMLDVLLTLGVLLAVYGIPAALWSWLSHRRA